MTVQVDRDMERAFAQLYEIQKHLLNGSLSPLVARRPLQDIVEGKFSADTRFERYVPMLLSLDEQQELLVRYNREYWGSRFTYEQLHELSVDTTRDHVQSVDDLEILHVEFGSIEETVEMWWKVFVGEQPDSWRWDGLKLDTEHIRFSPNTTKYEPGVHRVRINLVAHWEPEDGRTVDEVRKQASDTHEILAHSEVLSAYGLHSALLREQDGDNLPYADMAGYEATVPGGDAWRYVPCLDWSRFNRRVGLDAYWSGNRIQRWAAPVLRELES